MSLATPCARRAWDATGQLTNSHGDYPEALRAVAPHVLYIAVDGPRPTVPDDARAVAESRAVVELVDWDCELHTLFPEANVGAGSGPFGAIDWFLTSVERGIILEDDVVASPQFFAFASEMLDRYEDDHRVAGITQVLEVHSLDHPAGIDVQARNDPYREIRARVEHVSGSPRPAPAGG